MFYFAIVLAFKVLYYIFSQSVIMSGCLYIVESKQTKSPDGIAR